MADRLGVLAIELQVQVVLLEQLQLLHTDPTNRSSPLHMGAVLDWLLGLVFMDDIDWPQLVNKDQQDFFKAVNAMRGTELEGEIDARQIFNHLPRSGVRAATSWLPASEV